MKKKKQYAFCKQIDKKCIFKNGLFVRSISKIDPMVFLSFELIDYFD